MFTAQELQMVQDYIARTGRTFNFISDNGLMSFLKLNQPIATENDARYKCYSGPRRNKRKDVFISDEVQRLLINTCTEKRISQSNLMAQAILFFITKVKNVDVKREVSFLSEEMKQGKTAAPFS